MTPEQINIERMLDNAATASQCRGLLRDDYDNETPLREAVRRNVVDPLLSELSKLRAVAEAAVEWRRATSGMTTLNAAERNLAAALSALAAREEQG